ncbi:MAG: hypothetical protein WDM79_05555 [Terricaulis sp.]
MNEAVARAISAELSLMLAAFNRLTALTQSISDEDERSSYRRSLGELMVRCEQELVRPISKKYPHLDPIKG